MDATRKKFEGYIGLPKACAAQLLSPAKRRQEGLLVPAKQPKR
jgi:hypothetical protein